jgi:hypothetical protein
VNQLNTPNEIRTGAGIVTRLGRFTASQIGLLLKSGRSKSELFGQTAMSYIFGRAAEILTGEPISESTQVSGKSLEWGRDNEIKAVEAYVAFTGATVSHTGEAQQFFPYGEDAGASPDGLVGDDGVLEVKCPWNPTEHVRNMMLADQTAFKAYHDDYYPQIQMQLLCTGRKWCDFVSFDPRCVREEHRLHIIRIERDEEMIEVLKYRISEAVKERNKILQTINSRIL